ncbi:MAG TPA: hypothetical protein VFB34_06830 [Chloroflexota bacterium]|nr:hypothetical protein [Chloroflexota bacterium]
MKADTDVRTSMQTRIDELEGKLNQLHRHAVQNSQDDDAALRSRMTSLRDRLAETRERLREKEAADDKAEDAALAELGQAINRFYEEIEAGPR